MTNNAPQIDNADSDVNRLANALERAEFVDGDPELQAPADIPFQHPLVREFCDAWKAARRRPEIADKDLLPALKAVQQNMPGYLARWRVLAERRKTDAFQGGLRRLLEAFMPWSEAQLDQSIIRHRMACITEERKRRERAAGVVRRTPRRKPRTRSV